MASNKSSINTVMRGRMLDIVLLNDVSFQFAISTLTASQNINVHIWLVFRKCLVPPSSSNLLEKILIIVNNCHKRWKEVASSTIDCDFALHGIRSCSSDITLQWVHVIEFLQLNQQEKQAGHIWYTIKCMRKDLQEKWQIHLVVSPFEYRTAATFQALIPTLNAFQTSGGMGLWIWIGESVVQTMQCPLSHWWSKACFFVQHMLIKHSAFDCSFW